MSANRLLIVGTNLDGFSLVNHGWFAKLSWYMHMVISNGTRIKTLYRRMGNLLKVLERITGKVLSTLGSSSV